MRTNINIGNSENLLSYLSLLKINKKLYPLVSNVGCDVSFTKRVLMNAFGQLSLLHITLSILIFGFLFLKISLSSSLSVSLGFGMFKDTR